MAGQIIVLNGTPRAGKSSIAQAIQDGFDGVWMNLGLDKFKKATPERFQPMVVDRPFRELIGWSVSVIRDDPVP